MFGYVNVNKADLKVSEFEEYRAFYCGLCCAIKKHHGNFSRLTVNFDMTFLSILLADLYEYPIDKEQYRCPIHPLSKRDINCNKYQEYCADMTVFLSYLKCLDDWKDDKSVSRFAYSKAIKAEANKVNKKYPKKCRAIRNYLKQLSALEVENCESIDKVSSVFGHLLSEVFAVVDDNFTNILRNIGFYLGKFVYVMDAYLDYDKDKKAGNYNPLHVYENNDNLKEMVKAMLTELIAMAAKNYEMLPLDQYVPILDNIIYSGVWTNFYMKDKKEK